MAAPRLILASRSPRRVELLREAGYAFAVDPADIDEDRVPAGLSPSALAVHLAAEKARVVALRHRGAVVLGADTVVAVGSTLYGKAGSPDEARTMLRALMGLEQDVITGVAVFTPGEDRPATRAVRSVVAMSLMTDAQLDAYVAAGDWRGKAGAYGIQDHDPAGDPFVRIVTGDYTNVVGLPMAAVAELLDAAGVRPVEAAR